MTQQHFQAGRIGAPDPAVGGNQGVVVTLAAVPAPCQVLGQLILGMTPRLGQVFFPLDDDVVVGNIGITGFGHAGAGNVEYGFLAALCQLVDHIARCLAVLKQAVEQVLKAQFFGFFAVGLTQPA